MFSTRKQPNFIKDLAEIQKSVPEEIAIDSKTKNLELLSTLKGIEILWVFWVNQKEFNYIIKSIKPKHLYVYEMRFEDLSALEQLEDVETIHLQWNTRATKLWSLSKNAQLKTLVIEDFKRLENIDEISKCDCLKELSLSGGVTSNMLKVNTLEPLSHLDKLKTLELSNIHVKDESLEPVSQIKNLKELHISNQFPTEEYARLSVSLPNTNCRYFQPYVKLHQHIDGKNTMVVGKRKPFLNSDIDTKRLEKYSPQFKSFQDKHKQELTARSGY